VGVNDVYVYAACVMYEYDKGVSMADVYVYVVCVMYEFNKIVVSRTASCVCAL